MGHTGVCLCYSFRSHIHIVNKIGCKINKIRGLSGCVLTAESSGISRGGDMGWGSLFLADNHLATECLPA